MKRSEKECVILEVKDVTGILGISIADANTLVKTAGFPALHVEHTLIPKEAFFRWIESKGGRCE